jgi:hypothetical protein
MVERRSTGSTDARRPAQVPQIKVRTELRGGESLESCQKNVEYWQDEYWQHWDTVQQKLNNQA